jgi:hypothetical protein
MRKSRLGALGLIVLFVAPLLFSAEVQRSANYAYNFDVDLATTTYVRMSGANGDPFGGSRQGTGSIKTVGSSTTVTENVASTNPFRDILAGDVIQVSRSTTAIDLVVVTAKASDASITVTPAVNWSAGYPWRYWDTQSGTTDADGWISTSGASTVGLHVQYDQGDLDALKVRMECKGDYVGALPLVIYPGEASDCTPGGTLSGGFCEFTTAGITARWSTVDMAPVYSACRIGLAFKTTDTSDAGANLEKVTAAVTTGAFAR